MRYLGQFYVLAIILVPQADILGFLFSSEVCFSSPLLRQIAFCFFCMCHITCLKKRSAVCVTLELQLAGVEVTSGCSSRSPAQSKACCALAVHLCCGRQQMVNRLFFFAQEGVHPQHVVQQTSLYIKEMIRSLFQSQACLWHSR